METVSEWIEANQELLRALGTASLLILVVTVVAFPIVVAKLPEDYFTRERRNTAAPHRKHPLFWGLVAVAKNLLGAVLILAGLAMLILPGQGALTILVGLALTNFPGKYSVERRIACEPGVGRTLNRVRALAGQPPLQLPEKPTSRDRS